MKAPGLSYRCELTWNDLPGDSNTVRHCGECDKDVYNLTGMTKAQAARFLELRREGLCVHFAARDGQIVHDGDPIEQLERQQVGAKKLLAGALAVQAVFMTFGQGEKVLLDPFILGMTTFVRTFGETVEPKYEMGNMAVESEVTF